MEEEIKKEDHYQEKIEVIPKVEPISEVKTTIEEKKETSEDDDEISIGLSKDKSSNLFKSDENEETNSTITHIENKEDDEISVDFSKVKNKFKDMFKSEEPKKEKKADKKADIFSEEKDEEISFDFSKIKNIFKKSSHSERSDHSEKDEDISLDFKKISTFAKNNAKWIIPLILIFLAIGFSTYFRMMPSYLPATDNWAEDTVYNHYRSQLAQQINQQYPNLPQQNRDLLLDKELQNFLVENKDMLKQQVEATSQQYKAQLQDDDGQTYLLAIDPYLWFAEARNYVKYGEFGDPVNEEGERVFSLRNGRYGREPPQILFHPLAMAWIYKIFNPITKISLLRVSFLMPVLIIGLALIPAFFIGRRVSGNIGGFFAALLIALNGALLGRTPAGFSDTDAYNILFPLLIAWLFLLSYKEKDFKKTIIYAALAGLVSGVYATAWLGFWYVVDFIIITGVGLVLLKLTMEIRKGHKVSQLLKSKVVKSISSSTLAYILSSAVFISIFVGFERFIFLFQAPLRTIQLKSVAVTTLWPNVLTTVAEFNESSLSTIVDQMGGNLFFWIALMGIVGLLLNKKIDKINSYYMLGSAIYYLIIISIRTSITNPVVLILLVAIPVLIGLAKVVWYKEENKNLMLSILLIIWISGTIYGYTKGIRFSILMVPAIAIGFGAALGLIYNYLNSWLAKAIKLDARISKMVIIALFLLLMIAPISTANSIGLSEIPSMNDAWYNTLTKIKSDTERAMITSWWDFGHWFFTISERGTTFDGAGQGEKIHWVGKSLLTPEEKVSVGLLRMLNCGDDRPPHLLEEFFDGDTVKSVDVLNRMMVLNDRTAAIRLLKNEGLTDTQIADIIKITYCDDIIDQFYITSEDMVGKAGVWGHFGSWDFERASIYQDVIKDSTNGRELLVSKYDLTPETADEYYYQIINTAADQWISTWPGYQGGAPCSQEDDILFCNINIGQGTAQLQIDLTTMDASLPSNNGPVYPNSLVYATKQGIEEKQFTGSLMGVSVILLADNSQVLLSHPLQAKSIFTQLFFFNGHGLECFDKFDDVTSFNGQRIITWKVDFACTNKAQVYFLPKEEVNAAHILISTETRSEEEALTLVEQIKENLTKENFAQYAMEYSDDPGSKNNGGELGWFGKGVMVPEFETAAFSLANGEISNPIRSPFGYHIIYVLDKRNE